MGVMNFQKVDKVPLIGGFLGTNNTECEGSPICNRWHSEGLPIFSSVSDYFNIDFMIERVPINLSIIPSFPPTTLYEDSEYIIKKNSIGATMKILKNSQSWGMPQWLDFPVKNRNDWIKYKKLYDYKDPRRIGTKWGDELIEYYEKTDNPVYIEMSGFFGVLRELMGLENFLITFYKDPGLVNDMMDFMAEFAINALEPFIENCRIDFAWIWEDMAYKNGPHISPKFIKEFMVPRYRKETDFLKKHGIDLVIVDSDGDTRLIIPLWLEAGINCVQPLEVVANNDAVELRKKYPKLRMMGNINKFALIEGEEAIDKELSSKLPFLLKSGGFIPGVDHGLPPEIPFKNYKYYIQRLREYLNFT
jgi:uroporphyrinogen decarboxylase